MAAPHSLAPSAPPALPVVAERQESAGERFLTGPGLRVFLLAALAGTSPGSLAHDHYATKGTIALTLIFLACFAVYYFANWKALADVWPVR